MKYHFVNSSDEVIFSTIIPKCKSCIDLCDEQIITIDCPESKDKSRFGKIITKRGLTFLCTAEIKTTKVFKEKLAIFDSNLLSLDKLKHELKAQIGEEEKKRTKRLLHNLISLNGHNIQELYALVPLDILTKNIDTQIKIIGDTINESVDEAARMFLRVAKHNLAMKTEFSVFKKLFEGNPILDFSLHNVRRIILNILHTFFQDFTDKHIYVKVNDCNIKLKVDYDSIHVAFYHLIDNASKYSMPNKEVLIDFIDSDKVLLVRFDMTSILIEDDEVEAIFQEGYSGTNSKKLNKAGDGIGMSRIANLLQLNNATINVTRDYTKIDRYRNVEYSRNIFEIKFDKQ